MHANNFSSNKKQFFNNYIVLDYAAKGQLIEWNDEEEKFYFCHPQPTDFLSEDKLKQIFREVLIGIHYRIIKLYFVFINNSISPL